ncbi:carboxypeptidase B-like isoform X2 [Tigriopus californicus]|nr:carboxypeptidase B-like isoform X2 [Tigriopus californicus]|eukprot:TCALIF_00085-PA protein Name:"Similar to Carboxypeptidase B (Astacus astacus)" AED:0.18 eAED:0.18 QI:154/1/1/1/1/1/4/68/256
MEISQPKGSNKPAIWIDGGIHAREWISPASVTYMLSELVENSAYHQDLLSKYSFYIMPVMNPDGYEYTHTNDRLWRKARSPTHHSSCIGTDLNRNWGYKYGGKGASPNPCDETYRGPSAFSARETRAASYFILQRAHNMKMFLTFHSYGQYILYPWGYTANDEPSNWRDLHRIGQIGAQAMFKKNGHSYSVGSAAKLLYPAAGGSDDWAKGGAGIEYSYTIELPDAGRYGFLLPAIQIRNVTQEAFAGLEAMVNAL